MVSQGEDGCDLIDRLGFRHLQMHPDQVRDLERCGLRRFGDLARYPAVNLPACASSAEFARRRAERAARHIVGRGINWPAFWGSIDLHWLAMTFEEGIFEERVLDLPLATLSNEFGALLNIPQAAGLKTLRDLVLVCEEGLRPWRGFGALKVRKLGERLHELASGGKTISQGSDEMDDTDQPLLPADVLSWDIASLGLGAGSLKLRRNGYGTLASLQVEPDLLWSLPGVGKRTVALARSRLSLLAQAAGDGRVDLDRLADLQGQQIIPAADFMGEGDLFASVSAVLESVAVADGSEAALPLLRHRICTGGSDEVTLEEIAAGLTVRISRERVRQIESRILSRAATLLLSPYPVMGSVVVRPILRQRFRDLARAVEDREQIAPEELAVLISSEWECDMAEAVQLLPMVMAVIEGTARTFAELRQLVDSPPHYLRPLDKVAANWSAQNIGAERGLALRLEKMGIHDLEDLRMAWIGGSSFGRYTSHVRSVLNATAPGGIDEGALAIRLGELTSRPVVPAQKRSWSGYLASVREDVASIIATGTFRSDAELIFRERTSVLPAERITMDALGSKLGRLGVTVKQTETSTLTRLADAIIENREGYAQCILRPDWLAMWKELKRIHARFLDDQKTFRRSIEQVFGADEETVTMAMPCIWAILTGLPTRRSYGRVSVVGEQVSTLAPVRLAGFRSIH